jgi:hypothetical protein
METMTKPSRKAMRDALKDQTIQSILRVPKSTLTAKQAKFAEEVARGETKSNAYRKAYKPNAKTTTVNRNAHTIASNIKVQATIEAIKSANEAMKYQNAESLRSLAITSLVAVLTDPDSKPQVKIQASKIIGQITEVSLFTHRSETKVIHSSEDIKSKIIKEIQALMNEQAVDVIENDATTLLEELSTNSLISEDQDPTITPCPTFLELGALDNLHTIPSERSHQKSFSAVNVDTRNVDESDPPLVDGETPLSK